MDTISSIEDLIQEHLLQEETIQELKKELEGCDKKSLLINQYKRNFEDLVKLNNSKLSNNPRIELVRAISYAQLGDMNKLWLDVKEYNTSKIYGLVYHDYVAGIVVPKEGMPLALLIQDPKSSYAVQIGKEKAPGIVHGNNNKEIIVTFIPTWYKLNVGDEVVTSGLDDIFFKGIKVGKVISFTSSQGYQKAIVQPYYNSKDLHYFYMIKKVH